MTDRLTIVEATGGKGSICRELLASLPEWFGIPDAVEAYVAAVDHLPMLVARVGGEVVGFLSLNFHTGAAAEAYVLGVTPAWQRQGIGTRLFVAASAFAKARGCKYISVKTLAAAHPDPHYRATRLFYEAIGFDRIEVFPALWGAENPCLLMLKRLD